MTSTSNVEIYLMIAVAVVAMLMMAGAIVVFVIFYQKRMIREQMKRQLIEFEYQQKMMQAELESQESERRRLAADLHDSIGGMLSAIRVGLISIGRALPDPKAIQNTKQMLDETITSVRRISRDLLPSTLEKFGFITAIREMCERFHGTSQIPVFFEESGEVPELDKQVQLMVFRITQELLNNAIKHARASRIQVTIQKTDTLTVSVVDDGVGLSGTEGKNGKAFAKGLGLFNIENRARLIGAEVSFEETIPQGTRVTLTLPLQR